MPLDRQSYEQTYRLIQQLAGPFTEQVRAAARASHNEAEFRTRVTRHIEDEPTNSTHQRLAELSRRAHELAGTGDKPALSGAEGKALKVVEDEVDRAAAELWGLTEGELREIRESLAELRG